MDLITGNTGTAQLPMKERAENVYKRIVDRRGIRRCFIDPKVVKYLLKKDRIKLAKDGNWGITHTKVIAMDQPAEEDETAYDPYAKRIAAKEELKAERKMPQLKAEAKRQNKVMECKEFYVNIPVAVIERGKILIEPDVYSFDIMFNAIPGIYKTHASYIYGIDEYGKPFYAKKPKTKRKQKLTKMEMTFLRLKAKSPN